MGNVSDKRLEEIKTLFFENLIVYNNNNNNILLTANG
jgi:hypothetical protein